MVQLSIIKLCNHERKIQKSIDKVNRIYAENKETAEKRAEKIQTGAPEAKFGQKERGGYSIKRKSEESPDRNGYKSCYTYQFPKSTLKSTLSCRNGKLCIDKPMDQDQEEHVLLPGLPSMPLA